MTLGDEVALRSVTISALDARWVALLPGHPDLGIELLNRWSESHRHYHNLNHLADTLSSLTLLSGTSRTEHLAAWFHDAVHTGTAGADERASADLAVKRLSGIVGPDEVSEVARLIMITLDHDPAPDDEAGARVSDADLAALAADPRHYARTVAQLRREYARLNDGEWSLGRLEVVRGFLASDRIYRTPLGVRLWERQARINLHDEADQLAMANDDQPHGEHLAPRE